jgi:5'-methylthioadenosine phosphorylase
VEAVVKVLFDNADKARTLVRALVPSIGGPRTGCSQGCDLALDNAVITAPSMRSASLAEKLDAVAGRVLRQG